MGGLFVAAAVVSALLFLRAHERRLIPLALMFACLAGVEAREGWETAHRRWKLGALGAGLALAAMLARPAVRPLDAPARGPQP